MWSKPTTVNYKYVFYILSPILFYIIPQMTFVFYKFCVVELDFLLVISSEVQIIGTCSCYGSLKWWNWVWNKYHCTYWCNYVFQYNNVLSVLSKRYMNIWLKKIIENIIQFFVEFVLWNGYIYQMLILKREITIMQ